jgi:serine/threonine-protein kinase
MVVQSKRIELIGHIMTEIFNERYQLDQELGQGGMALVYQATDLMLERTIAVKVLKEDFSKSKAFQERFKQEARAAANLTHPNIVTVHDFGLDQDQLFIVMEYVPGIDLKQIIKRDGFLDLSMASRLFVQACAGIGYAHRAGLVHCDIKPHNMIITPDNRLKVTDFGIARALASVRPDEQYDAIWGSPAYFSPEQAAGKAPSPASDVYSLGIVLFEMLTGQLPFQHSSPQELALMHRYEAPPSAREINPEITPELETIIQKVLSKEPAARYRTADQLGRIMINFTQNDTPSIPVQSPAAPGSGNSANDYQQQAIKSLESLQPGKRWITIVMGLVALLAVGGLIPFWIWVYYQIN